LNVAILQRAMEKQCGHVVSLKHGERVLLVLAPTPNHCTISADRLKG
jgi:hypothetical protein